MNRNEIAWGILLAVGAVLLAAWALLAQPPESTVPVDEVPQSFAPPTEESTAGQCYWNWAREDLPQLSTQVQQALQEIQPDAQARAEAYGENCIYEDGHADFHAMETDYYITLQAADVNNPAELGKLTRETMDLLLARFPIGQTPGPQPGLVALTFRSPAGEQPMHFSISDYRAIPSGMPDAELFQSLSQNP